MAKASKGLSPVLLYKETREKIQIINAHRRITTKDLVKDLIDVVYDQLIEEIKK